MVKLLLLSAVALAIAAPATAQTAPPAATPAQPVTQLKDPNRIICEREEEIGTRLGGTKVCKTALEWQESRQQHRDTVDDWQRRLTSPGKPGT